MNLSANVRDAIRKILDDVENTQGILDVYEAAQALQRAHPDETIALDDLMVALMAGRGSVRAIEFNRPANPA